MLVLGWNLIGHHLGTLRKRWQSLVIGLAFGLVAMGSIAAGIVIAPGVIFDFRMSIVGAAAIFGGPLAGIVAALASGAFRIYLGGAVIPASLLALGAATALGSCFYFAARRRPVSMRDVLVFSILLATICAAAILRLPIAGQPAFAQSVLLPAVTLAFAGTFVWTGLLVDGQRRQALAAENELYRAMVDTLPDCLNIKDRSGRFLVANPATARFMGAASPAALIGKTDADFFDESECASFAEDEAEMIASGVARSFEQRLDRGPYLTEWLATLKVPLRDADGGIIGIITHNRDISIKKSLELELEETQGQLRDAMENMADGLAMFDAAGRFVYCNPRYLAMFPKTAHRRIKGAHFRDILEASIDTGEETLGSTDRDAWIAHKLASLHREGVRQFTLEDGRTIEARTRNAGNGGVLSLMTDVTERVAFQRELERAALHDTLTGLPNRAHFNKEFDRRLAASAFGADETALLLLDLNRFKQVNDTCGHAAGDQLLIEIGRRLEAAIGPEDFVARLGGDEFAVLVSADRIGDRDIIVANAICRQVARPLALDDVVLTPGVSIGIALSGADTREPKDFLTQADKALYVAKKTEHSAWRRYDAQFRLGEGSRRRSA